MSKGLAARVEGWRQRFGDWAEIATQQAGPSDLPPFPQRPLAVSVRIYVDASWLDITPDVYGGERAEIEVTRGRSSERVNNVEVSNCTMQINNRLGKYSPRNPMSVLYGKIGRNTPLQILVDGLARFTGEVPAWPQKWDTTGTDVWVPIEAAGIMRRLGQGKKPLRSALRRYVPKNSFVKAYWPMEDGQDSTNFASGLSSGKSMKITGRANIQFASQEVIRGGSENLPILQSGASAFGQVGSMQPPTVLPWRVDTLFFMEAQPAGYRACIAVYVLGSSNIARYEIQCFTNLRFIAFDEDGATAFSSTGAVTLPADFYGSWVRLSMWVQEVGGPSVDFIVKAQSLDGRTFDTLADAISPFNAGRPSSAGINVVASDARGLGHVTVSSDTVFVSNDPFGQAYNGHTFETANDRFVRLCSEEGIQYETVGFNIDGESMGPQKAIKLIELLQECADADQGILYEPRDFLGLALRSRQGVYNQMPILALDYTSGALASVPEPVDDDQLTRNDVTVSQPDGSSARVTLDEGALSTQDAPDGVGVYDEDFPANISADERLADLASWRVHLGTVDEARFPLIHLHLHNDVFASDADLTSAAVMLDIGDRFTIENVPAWLGPDLITLLAQGFTETLSNFTRDIRINASPESPWQIAVAQAAIGATGDKADTDGSELFESIDEVDTSFQVSTTRGPLWTQVDAEDGFDIFVGGERITVTDIAGGSSPQIFTVTRSVNGVVKSHLVGTKVRLWKTPIFGL